MGSVFRAGGGWTGDLLIAHCEDLQNVCRGSNTEKSHKKERCRFHVPADLSNSSIFLNVAKRSLLKADILYFVPPVLWKEEN